MKINSFAKNLYFFMQITTTKHPYLINFINYSFNKISICILIMLQFTQIGGCKIHIYANICKRTLMVYSFDAELE